MFRKSRPCLFLRAGVDPETARFPSDDPVTTTSMNVRGGPNMEDSKLDLVGAIVTLGLMAIVTIALVWRLSELLPSFHLV